MYFLVQFKRSRQALISMQMFENRSEAVQTLSVTERLNDDPDVEVVLLSSDSEATLRRTHSRYFSATGVYDLVAGF